MHRILTGAPFETAFGYSRDRLADPVFLDRIVPVLAQAIKDALPAAVMVVAGLIRPEMKVEIEVTVYRE